MLSCRVAGLSSLVAWIDRSVQKDPKEGQQAGVTGARSFGVSEPVATQRRPAALLQCGHYHSSTSAPGRQARTCPISALPGRPRVARMIWGQGGGVRSGSAGEWRRTHAAVGPASVCAQLCRFARPQSWLHLQRPPGLGSTTTTVSEPPGTPRAPLRCAAGHPGCSGVVCPPPGSTARPGSPIWPRQPLVCCGMRTQSRLSAPPRHAAAAAPRPCARGPGGCGWGGEGGRVRGCGSGELLEGCRRDEPSLS